MSTIIVYSSLGMDMLQRKNECWVDRGDMAVLLESAIMLQFC